MRGRRKTRAKLPRRAAHPPIVASWGGRSERMTRFSRRTGSRSPAFHPRLLRWKCRENAAESHPAGARVPGKKQVRGVGEKEQRMYEHIKESAQKEGRYGKRAEEVAVPSLLSELINTGIPLAEVCPKMLAT